MSEDPFRVLYQGGDPNDTRFQFEIIKGLSESIRQMAEQMGHLQRTQVSMLERLATLEAGKVGARMDAMGVKIDALFKDKDRRDGALGMLGVLRVWGPVIFSLLCALYLYGRASGVVPSPPATVTKIETPLRVEERAPAAPVTENGNVH